VAAGAFGGVNADNEDSVVSSCKLTPPTGRLIGMGVGMDEDEKEKEEDKDLELEKPPGLGMDLSLARDLDG